MSYIKTYFYLLMSAISRLMNAFCGNDPRETLSSHIGKKLKAKLSLTLAEKIYYACLNPILGSSHWIESIDPTVGDGSAWDRQNDSFV